MNAADRHCNDKRYQHPSHRRLNIFSVDPAADTQLETALISRSVVHIPWEPLSPGPVGRSVEVVDIDPSSSCVYEPIDLDHHALLANDGIKPSTGNPQFHQQMVYAVAMKTILNFEQVLGRTVMWSERTKDENGRYLRKPEDRFVERLRIYPHALREANAYYSPDKKALLMGYFHATTLDPRDDLPGGMVFTCLSHDIIAHETTHAILDGMHHRLLEARNDDMLAFHEAFADIVAVFQHFTLPGLLLDQITRSRGDLRKDNLLARLASQFARSTGRGSALRNALGTVDAAGRQLAADPTLLSRTFEPHERGAILVAAVFDAFLLIYENRAADLWRLSAGCSALHNGDIHPDLAMRLADEAVKAAQRVLNICIRAIDYLPPVDITFGDYLRALVTADFDFFPEDIKRHRLAFLQAFRNHGIYPNDVRTLAEDALRWNHMSDCDQEELRQLLPPPEVLRTMASAYDVPAALLALLGDEELTEGADTGPDEMWGYFREGKMTAAASRFLEGAWQSGSDGLSGLSNGSPQYTKYRVERLFAKFLHGWLRQQANNEQLTQVSEKIGWHFGLDVRKLASSKARLEIHAVRPTLRMRPDGRSKMELLVMLTQSETRDLRETEDGSVPPDQELDGPLQFRFRGGATVIIDPEDGRIIYAISKNLGSTERFRRQAQYLRRQLTEFGGAAMGPLGIRKPGGQGYESSEPFASLHAGSHSGGGY